MTEMLKDQVLMPIRIVCQWHNKQFFISDSILDHFILLSNELINTIQQGLHFIIRNKRYIIIK